MKDFITMRHPKNTALTLVFPITDADGGNTVTGEAAGSPDRKRSLDGASFADCTNDIAEIDTTGWYTLTLSATEMNNTSVAVKITGLTAGSWTPRFTIYTYEDSSLDDANTELAAIPTTTGTLREMIQFLHGYFRNLRTETSGVESLKKEDAATELGSRTLADNGSTFTRGEMN